MKHKRSFNAPKLFESTIYTHALKLDQSQVTNTSKQISLHQDFISSTKAYQFTSPKRSRQVQCRQAATEPTISAAE